MKLINGSRIDRIKLIVAAVILAAVSGCGGGGGHAEENALQDAPSEVAALYKASCINCHGSDLQGRVGANTNLQKVGSRMSASEIVAQIGQGEGVMPGFADQLTADEIESLANWLAGKK